MHDQLMHGTPDLLELTVTLVIGSGPTRAGARLPDGGRSSFWGWLELADRAERGGWAPGAGKTHGGGLALLSIRPGAIRRRRRARKLGAAPRSKVNPTRPAGRALRDVLNC
jgi:hypothetical protein